MRRDRDRPARAPDQPGPDPSGLLRQGWLSLALWMSVGLLLEGLLAYKIPAYLDDPQRRELLRLAHAHGTLLALVLVVAALWAERRVPPRAALAGLRLGAAIMPLGFGLAGIWHPEGDPGPLIWAVPPAALLVIFGIFAIALSHFRKAPAK